MASGTAGLSVAWRGAGSWPRGIWLQALRWRQRLIFLFGGCIVGLASAGMAVGADMAHGVFDRLLAL